MSRMIDTARAVADFAYRQGVGDACAIDDLIAENERLREALSEIIAEGYDGAFAVETARNALGLPITGGGAQQPCKVCGAGPNGRCDPPDDYEGECPHGCSPER